MCEKNDKKEKNAEEEDPIYDEKNTIEIDVHDEKPPQKKDKAKQ